MMAYKGAIQRGCRVAAELVLDPAAGGHALVAVAYASNARSRGSRALTVAPGVTDHCEIPTSDREKGMVRITVDLNRDADPATLTVYVDGQVADSARLAGDTTWVYAVS